MTFDMAKKKRPTKCIYGMRPTEPYDDEPVPEPCEEAPVKPCEEAPVKPCEEVPAAKKCKEAPVELCEEFSLELQPLPELEGEQKPFKKSIELSCAIFRELF